MLDAHAALIYTMVLVTGAETGLPETERAIIGDIVSHLPAFHGLDQTALAEHLENCAELLSGDDGLNATLAAIAEGLPPHLRETAYLIACDLIASDGEATQEELQVLDLIRERLQIDRLIAAALERGARARFRR